MSAMVRTAIFGPLVGTDEEVLTELQELEREEKETKDSFEEEKQEMEFFKKGPPVKGKPILLT